MVIARLSFLYIHVVAFALALGCVLREDAKLLSHRPLELLSLRSSSTIIAAALAVLWCSGLAIILLDTRASISALGSNPKVLAKLIVVSLLTINGLALHRVAFPSLRNPPAKLRPAANVIVALGAVSSVSWAFATLLGISKGITNELGLEGIITIYCATLVAAIFFAIIFVAPSIERKLRERRCGAPSTAEEQHLLTR